MNKHFPCIEFEDVKDVKERKIYIQWILYNSYNNSLIGSGYYGQHYLYQFDNNLNIKKRGFIMYSQSKTSQTSRYITASSVQNYTGNYLFTNWQTRYIVVYSPDFNLMYYIKITDDMYSIRRRFTYAMPSMCSDVYGNIYTITDRHSIIHKFNEKGLFIKTAQYLNYKILRSDCICQYKSQIISANSFHGTLNIYDNDLRIISNHKIHEGEKIAFYPKCQNLDNLLYIQYNKDIYCYDMRKILPDNNKPLDIIKVNSDDVSFTIVDGRLLISEEDKLYYH